jgi:hypothetical protein
MRFLRPVLALLTIAAISQTASADIIYGTRSSDSVVATNGDDFSTGPHALGFNFDFYGSTFNDVYMNSNGNLTFGGSFTTFTNGPLPFSTSRSAVMPFWDDLFLFNTRGSEMRINTSVTGEFTALWSNTGFFAQAAATSDLITFETILLGAGNSFGLANGSIIFSYDNNINFPNNGSGDTFTVGLNKGDGISANTLSSVIGSNPDGTIGYNPADAAYRNAINNNSFLFTPDNNGGYTVSQFGNVNAVPAPPSLILAGVGLVGAVIARRRKTAV